MATLLSQYQEQQKKLLETLDAGKLAQDKLLALQELNYRICVLQTMQAYCKSAPVSTDLRQIGYARTLQEKRTGHDQHRSSRLGDLSRRLHQY